MLNYTPMFYSQELLSNLLQEMDDQIQEILKRQQIKGEKVSLGSLRHNATEKTAEIDEQTLNKLQKIKKYHVEESTTSLLTEKLNQYYCSLCGRICIVTNVLLENRPTRKTDEAIAINLKNNFIKLNLQRQKIRYLKRENGIEKQYRWKCQCGIPVGYTAVNYDDFEDVRRDDNPKMENKSFFYVFNDAMVEKMKQSKVIGELITYKETILLHMKTKAHRK